MVQPGVIRWSLLALTLVLLSGPPSAVALDKLRFPYSPIAYQSLPWMVAKEARLFERHGLDVDIIFAGASSLIIQSMLAGEADVAGLGGPAVITNVLKGGDVIQVAALIKTFTIPMYVHPSIRELAQLRGKVVGVSRFGAVSHLTAQAVLHRAGIEGVTIVQTGGVPESAAALSTGSIAGAMVAPPYTMLLREKGFRELVGIKQLREMDIRFVEQGIAARRSYAERNPETVKRVVRAVLEGLRRMHDDRELTIRVQAKYTKIDNPKILDEGYRVAIDAFAKDPRVPPQALSAMIEQLIALKTLDPVVARKTPLTAYHDNRYVEELEREGFLKQLWQQ